MAQVSQLLSSARADYEAQRAQNDQARYTQGYESYIQNRLDSVGSDYDRGTMYYSLYDLNGDGVSPWRKADTMGDPVDSKWRILSIRRFNRDEWLCLL